MQWASPTAGWDPYTLDSHSRESPGSLGCWSLMAGSSEGTPVAWTPQECFSKCGWRRMIQEAHQQYCYVPSPQQSQTLKSCHGQENTLATLWGFRQQTYCKSKRQRTWVLLTELITRALYHALAMKVSQRNHNCNARHTFSQRTKSQPLIILWNNYQAQIKVPWEKMDAWTHPGEAAWSLCCPAPSHLCSAAAPGKGGSAKQAGSC